MTAPWSDALAARARGLIAESPSYPDPNPNRLPELRTLLESALAELERLKASEAEAVAQVCRMYRDKETW